METTTQASPRLLNLIEDAITKAGNEAKLAAFVEATRHNVNAWKHGTRSCPIEAQILMATLTKRDVDVVIREALIERNAGTPRGEKLVSALGKAVCLVGVATVLTLSGSDVLASKLPTFHDVYYVKYCLGSAVNQIYLIRLQLPVPLL